MSTGRIATIAGASGLTGSHCLDQLLKSDQYSRIISLVRKHTGRTHPKLTEHIVNFDAIKTGDTMIEGDDLFCCLGTTIRKAGSKEAFRKVDQEYPLQLAEIALNNGISQFLIITSLGADSGSSVFYSKVKGEVEDSLMNMEFKGIHVFQPSLLLGQRNESRFGEAIAQGILPKLNFLIAGPFKKYRAIHAEDVARAMINTALNAKPGFHSYRSDQIQRIAEGGKN